MQWCSDHRNRLPGGRLKGKSITDGRTNGRTFLMTSLLCLDNYSNCILSYIIFVISNDIIQLFFRDYELILVGCTKKWLICIPSRTKRNIASTISTNRKERKTLTFITKTPLAKVNPSIYANLTTFFTTFFHD